MLAVRSLLWLSVIAFGACAGDSASAPEGSEFDLDGISYPCRYIADSGDVWAYDVTATKVTARQVNGRGCVELQLSLSDGSPALITNYPDVCGGPTDDTWSLNWEAQGAGGWSSVSWLFGGPSQAGSLPYLPYEGRLERAYGKDNDLFDPATLQAWTMTNLSDVLANGLPCTGCSVSFDCD